MSLPKFKALADETRLRLVRVLVHYELSVNELVQIMGMGQSRVSRHLKILAEAGLLNSRRDGLWVFYGAPRDGSNHDFLRAMLPFFPNNPQMKADLDLAGEILEERSRKTRQFFNAIAENWDDLNRETLGDFDLSARVLAAMPRECRVAVDLGCGTGAVLKNMISRTDLVIGVDGSARMLDLCRSRICAKSGQPDNVSLRIGELSHLPLADCEADFACLNLVLHHLARPNEIFGEIQRILKPGGALFIADFLRHNDETMRLRYGDHWLGFARDDLEKFLTDCRFSIKEVQTRKVEKHLSLIMLTARAP